MILYDTEFKFEVIQSWALIVNGELTSIPSNEIGVNSPLTLRAHDHLSAGHTVLDKKEK